MNYGVFEENGIDYVAWEPANDQAKRVFVIEAWRDGEKLGSREVPMTHSNIWGVDVDDANSLNEAVEEFIKEIESK